MERHRELVIKKDTVTVILARADIAQVVVTDIQVQPQRNVVAEQNQVLVILV